VPALAKVLPTFAAPRKGTNDPIPSPSFVLNLSAYLGSAASNESSLNDFSKPCKPLRAALSSPISNKETIPVGTDKAKLAAPLGIALPNSTACSSAEVLSKSSPCKSLTASTNLFLSKGSVGILYFFPSGSL